MKNKFALLSIVLITLLGLTACSGVAAPAGQAAPRTISVNGSGSVTLSPDMAQVNIGVQTQGEDAEQASAENAQTANAIIAALQELGITETDIKTSNFSVYPQQRYDSDNQLQAVTYVVNNSVLVTVHDLDKLGDVLDAAIGAGANAINGVTFDVSDREGAIAQALEAAMQNAEGRAEVLAQAANTKIAQVQSVSTYINGGSSPVQYRMEAADADSMASSVPISAGEMEIQVDVSVVYEIN